MVREAELKCENDVRSFDNSSEDSSIIFKWKKKRQQMKNRFLKLHINLYQIKLLQIIIKTKIYVVCNKCEFLLFPDFWT